MDYKKQYTLLGDVFFIKQFKNGPQKVVYISRTQLFSKDIFHTFQMKNLENEQAKNKIDNEEKRVKPKIYFCYATKKMNSLF